MKKTLVLILGVVLLNSCQSVEEKKKADDLAAKAEEAKCRADFSHQIYQYGMNKMEMGLRVGMNKEIDDFQKMQSDTIAKCADLKKAWEELGKKIDVKWNAEN
jgi:hypothetical protein